MKYLDLFSGISAPTVAWKPLGWQAVAYAEIEKFPSAVLAHHYPTVPNVGDVTKVNWDEWKGKADLVIAGSPCQSFSTAGKRKGLDDERGNLALEAIRIARRVDAKWFILENAPGILSANQGYAFARVLHEMAECGFSCAWRVLNAKYFGVPQRRRRVYLVGHSRDWSAPARLLFNQSQQNWISESDNKKRWQTSTQINRCASPIAFSMSEENCYGVGISPTLRRTHGGRIAFLDQGRLRYSTVEESLSLQGFPRDYLTGLGTGVWQKFEAIGNSMAVPVIRWLGNRIEQVEAQKEMA